MKAFDAGGPASVTADVSILRTMLAVAVILLTLAIAFIVILDRRPASGIALPANYSVVHVDEFEFGIRLDTTSIPAGNVAFVDTNRGAIPHEFVMFSTDRPASKLPLGRDGAVSEDAPGLETVADSGSSLDPGETRLVTTTLDPGHYVIVCNLPPNHYRAGMRLNFTVTAGRETPPGSGNG